MSENKEINPTLITLSLVGLTALLAYLERQSGLQSERPKQETVAFLSPNGDQNLPARLWQDPFSIIKDGMAKGSSGSQVRQQILHWLGAGYKVSFLAIFLEGTPYPEDLEVRLRLRYAAQTALLESRFTPADRSHLGLLTSRWPSRHYLAGLTNVVPEIDETMPPVGQESLSAELSVAFEWLLRDGDRSPPEAVLVLWLPEEEFEDHPLTRLLILKEMLVRNVTEGAALPLKILGPRSSNTLKSFLTDRKVSARVFGQLSGEQLLANLTLCSPEATAPDAFLMDDVPVHSEARAITRKYLRDNASVTNFINLIATDDQLATNLVAELKLRGVKIESNHLDQIVLISEADTLYGRSLPICFAAAVETITSTNTSFSTNLKNLIQTGNWTQANLMRFSYLRGLDGTLARSEQSQPETESESKSDLGQRGTAPNRAEGDAQFDYARRLAERIKEAVESGSRYTHPRLKAIGILGSDIYDKLILLQALRPVFPDAWFFTTDLDARYLNAHLYPFTRNLVVSSAYGLQDPSETSSVTPFRDGYQTALYVGCKYLLSDGGPQPPVPQPRIYEIGRSEAVSFPVSASLKKAEDIVLSVALPIAVLLLLVCYAGAARFQKWFPSLPFLWDKPKVAAGDVEEELIRISKRRFLWQSTVWVIGAFGLLALCIAAFGISSTKEGEPLYFAEGVSIWPTEFVRLFACILALSFVVRGWHAHQRNRVLMWRDYFRNESLRNFQEQLETERQSSRHPWTPSPNESGAAITAVGRPKKWRARVREILAALCERRAQISISLWEETSPTIITYSDSQSKPQGPVETGTTQTWRDHPPVDAHELFCGYAKRGLLINRLFRSVPMAVVYILLCGVVIQHFGLPSVPARGTWSQYIDRAILVAATLAFSFLTFYVIDAVRLTQRFVQRLSQANTIWPPAILGTVAELRKMDPRHLDGYLDVMFTARHTREVSTLAFYPFTILFLMFISRNQFFDHWTWPAGLAAIFFLNALIIFVPAFAIRRTAHKVRDAAIRNLQHLQSRFVDGHHEWASPEDLSNRLAAKKDSRKVTSDTYGEALKLTLDEIQETNTGAYSGILQDSTVIAALIPSGGVGLITLLEKLFMPG